MKKFRYIGNCNGMTFRGLNFPINEPVEVESLDDIAKLEGNSHFSEVKSRKKAVDNGNESGNQG